MALFEDPRALSGTGLVERGSANSVDAVGIAAPLRRQCMNGTIDESDISDCATSQTQSSDPFTSASSGTDPEKQARRPR